MLFLVAGGIVALVGLGLGMYGVALVNERDYVRAQRKRERDGCRWLRRHRGQRWGG